MNTPVLLVIISLLKPVMQKYFPKASVKKKKFFYKNKLADRVSLHLTYSTLNPRSFPCENNNSPLEPLSVPFFFFHIVSFLSGGSSLHRPCSITSIRFSVFIQIRDVNISLRFIRNHYQHVIASFRTIQQ